MTENLLIQQDHPQPTVEPCPKCGAVHWIHEEMGGDLDRMRCLECRTTVWGCSGLFTSEPALVAWNALSKERHRLKTELDATKDKLAKAIEIADVFSGGVEYDYHGNIIGEEERKAMAELEELTGGKDE